MNKGANVFGAALIAYWIAIVLNGFLPIKDDLNNLAILAVIGFVLAGIFGLLDGKNKLF
jgi:hypothetical protein